MQYVHQVHVGLQTAAGRLEHLVSCDQVTRKSPRFCFSVLKYILQIYFYTNYLFQQAGIPSDKIPYVTIGTGACECMTALTCVSIWIFTFQWWKTQTKWSTNNEKPAVWPSQASNLKGKLTSRNDCFSKRGFMVLWPAVCASQGFLIESLGRKVLITGGYTLMSICCILLTLTLTFQVSPDWSCTNK